MYADRQLSFDALEPRMFFSASPSMTVAPEPEPSSATAAVVVPANVPDAGETIGTAAHAGIFFGPRVRTFAQDVGVTLGDNVDYYKFRVTTTLHVTVTLAGLTDDLDLRLQRLNGSAVGNSLNTGTSNESITRVLTPGWYAIKITPFFLDESAYVLRIRSAALPADVGDTRQTAAQLPAFNGPRSVEVAQTVGYGSDTGDWYKFRVNKTMKFDISVTNLTADVDLGLYRNNGQQITSSTKAGSQNEMVSRTLTPGWYYLRVDPYQTAQSSYALKLVAENPAGLSASANRAALAAAHTTWLERIGAGDETDRDDAESALDVLAPVLPVLA